MGWRGDVRGDVSGDVRRDAGSTLGRNVVVAAADLSILQHLIFLRSAWVVLGGVTKAVVSNGSIALFSLHLFVLSPNLDLAA